MAWTAARTYVVAEIITATILNVDHRDNIRFLHGDDGPITLQDALIIDNSLGTEYLTVPSLTTTQRDALTPVNGMIIYNSTLTVFQRYEAAAWVSFTNLAAMTIGSIAQGDMFFRGASLIERLGAETSGYFLKTQGAAANPIWAALPNLPSSRGILPVATGWGTAPTTLANITDGNLATETGEGIGTANITAETNDTNEITIDLGSAMFASRIVAQLAISTGGGGTLTTARLRAGTANNLTDEQIGADVTEAGASLTTHYIQGGPTGDRLVRYISLRCWTNAAGGATARMSIAEIAALGAI